MSNKSESKTHDIELWKYNQLILVDNECKTPDEVEKLLLLMCNEYKMSEELERNTLKLLYKERDDVMDEIESWKRYHLNTDIIKRKYKIMLWENSDDIGRLSFDLQSIQMAMYPFLVVSRMKFYIYLQNTKNIPKDIILYIATFGNEIDNVASHFILHNVESTIKKITDCLELKRVDGRLPFPE